MPFMRPKLSDLRAQVSADITAGLPSADGLLRFSNLNILGTAVAGLGHLNYGYLDWIAKQSVPYTASGEFLESWAALKKVYRKTATSATGQVTFPASAGAIIDAGTEVIRSDSVVFNVDTTVVAGASGAVVASVTAAVAGATGNTQAGSLMTLGASIDGVQSRVLILILFIIKIFDRLIVKNGINCSMVSATIKTIHGTTHRHTFGRDHIGKCHINGHIHSYRHGKPDIVIPQQDCHDKEKLQ